MQEENYQENPFYRELIELMDQMILDYGLFDSVSREFGEALKKIGENEEEIQKLKDEYEPRIAAAKAKADQSYKKFHDSAAAKRT